MVPQESPETVEPPQRAGLVDPDRPMRVIASTVVRESRVGLQLTGSIFDLAWQAGEVSASLPIEEPRNPATSDNPRGGVRGGRGIAITPEGIVVANYDTLHFYDRDWALRRTIAHPLFLGLHEICFDGTHLYLSATAIDAVLRIDRGGEVEVCWDPHDGRWRRRFGVSSRPSPLDPGATELPLQVDECHLNGIACTDAGVVANLGKIAPPISSSRRLWHRSRKALARAVGRSTEGLNPFHCAIVALGEPAPEVLIELSTAQGLPLHNGQRLPDGRLIVNDSNQDEVRLFAADGGEELTRIRIPGNWLRGLCPLGGDQVLVGSAPATVSQVDLASGTIVHSVRLSENPNEAVHGLIAAAA